jgi:hypothetical protein
MHTLAVAPETSKGATIASTQTRIVLTIDSVMIPLPKPKKLSNRRAVYGQKSGLCLGDQWLC